MGEIIYDKLVRDKIPQIISDDHQTPVTRTLNDEEYRQKLLEKLIEEAQELLDAKGDLEERVDVAEVLKALDSALGYTDEEIENARAQKAEKRGGFEQRIFLEKAITHD